MWLTGCSLSSESLIQMSWNKEKIGWVNERKGEEREDTSIYLSIIQGSVETLAISDYDQMGE